MTQLDGDTGPMLTGLLGVIGDTALEDLPDTVGEHARRVGFTDVRIYVGDVERRALHLLAGRHPPASAERIVQMQDTVPGRAYQLGTVLCQYSPATGDFQYAAPIYNGSERLGVLCATHGQRDDTLREAARLLAFLVALVLVLKRDRSDAYARLNRTQPMNVAAEALWQTVPPRTYVDAQVAITATLQPWFRIGGDAYDYSIAGPLVYLSVFDAMGHDTSAGQSAALAVAASRNARRNGADFVETGAVIEHELVEQFDGARHATALLASLDTRFGTLNWTTFGNPPPLVVHGSEGIVLHCPPALPLGTGLGDPGATTCQHQLEPGDRVVLYTNGITEAHRPHDREFGMDRLIATLTRHPADELSVGETLRRFVHAFLDYHDRRLQDDACALLCEWLSPRSDG